MATRSGPLLILLAAACTEPEGAKDQDTDTPEETDADTDTDTDADTDTGTDLDGDGVTVEAGDCDDGDPSVFPGAPDLCGDDRVTDCDRTSDDGLVTLDGATGFDDLGRALAAASPGSELLLCPGTYTGTFASTVAVSLSSYTNAEETIVDGDGGGRTLALPGGSAVIGLTLTGGAVSGRGGGLWQSSPGTLAVLDSVITGNRAVLGGGLAVSELSEVTVSGTAIRGNLAVDRGGGLMIPEGTAVDLDTSVIEDNEALSGGGVIIENGTLLGGEVLANEATGTDDDDGGGGVLVIDGGSVQGTQIRENIAATAGAGVAVMAGAGELVDVSIRDNVCGTGSGGGLYAMRAEVTLSGSSEISGHACPSGPGGGALLYGSTLTGGVLTSNSALQGGGVAIGEGRLLDVTVEDNAASDAGGGVWIFGAVDLLGGRIAGNTAPTGGGIGTSPGDFYAPPLLVDGVEIADNVAGSGGGVAIRAAEATLVDAVLVRNQADSGGGAWIEGVGSLSSQDTDWGEGVDDNLPGDIFAGSEISGYGVGATFTCTSTGCDPLP